MWEDVTSERKKEIIYTNTTEYICNVFVVFKVIKRPDGVFVPYFLSSGYQENEFSFDLKEFYIRLRVLPSETYQLFYNEEYFKIEEWIYCIVKIKEGEI